MKKSVILLLVLTICFAAFAGGTKESSNNKYNTLKDGVLTIATSPDYAPYEFYSIAADGTPSLAGFDIELGKYIGKFLGVEVEFIPMDFDGILMELQNKGADLGISGFSPNPEREEVVDFSQIYYDGKQAFICLKSNASKFKTLADTNKKEYSVGAQLGAIQMDLAQQYSPDADLVALTKVTDIIAEVLAGKVDGAYVEELVAKSYSANYPELVVALDVPYDSEGNVVLVQKGNNELLTAVKEAIDAAMKDGSMAKFVEEANALSQNGDIVEDSHFMDK